MKRSTRWLTVLLLLSGTAVFAAGTLKGVVKSGEGPAPGVLVEVRSGDEIVRLEETNESGRFLASIAAGTYTVVFSFPGLLTHTEDNVQVKDGSATDLNITMTAPLNVMEVLTVASASRRAERIVEAPAAVTVITNKEIAAQSGSGQLPKVLEATPGVELAQNGVFDFNINARGFNSSLNRRVLVLVDGRDPATGFLGNQEWSAMGHSMDLVQSMEFVRGPGSALYGANAFNGVLNIRTIRPADNQGGQLNVTGGNLNTLRLDFKYAGEINPSWHYRVNGGVAQSDDWAVNRVSGVDGPPFEYPGLEGNGEVHGIYQRFTDDPSNPVEDIKDNLEQRYLTARIDGEFSGGELLTFEAGMAVTERGPSVTGLGRVRVDEAERPWFRANYNTKHWNFMATYTGRNTPKGQTSLNSGGGLWEDSSNTVFEIQGNYDFMDGRLQVVGGASHRIQEVDTANKAGFQTLMASARDEDQTGVFGQAKFEVNEKLDLVVAGRWDDSSLHDSQESPKAAIVYKINPNHSLRATWGKAFQTPNYSEFFLRAAAARIPFGDIQDAVSGALGLDLRSAGILNWQNGFASAVGNPDLVPEEIESYEVGYKGVVSEKLYVTVDYYQAEAVNFVTDLLPGVNPNITPYEFPDGVPVIVQQTLFGILQQVLPAGFFSGLTGSNTLYSPVPGIPDGNPLVTISYANAGEVETEGLDFAFNYYIDDHWSLNGNYSWFDFDVIDSGLEGDRIVPNSAETKYNFGVNYNADKMSAGLTYHFVDEFPYAAGVFVGEVPQYDTVNLHFGWNITDNLRLDLNGNNVLDEEHYELMGGSLNGARYLGTIKYNF